MDGSQRIRRFVQTTGYQPFAVGTDGDCSNATEIYLLPAVVRMQWRGIKRSYFFARRDFPLLKSADEVTAVVTTEATSKTR